MSDILDDIIAMAEAAVVADTSVDSGKLARWVGDVDFAEYGSAEGCAYLAVLLDSLGLHEEAIHVLDQVRDEDGSEGSLRAAVLRNLQGILLSDKGQYSRAIKAFEVALAAASEDISLRQKILTNLATTNLRAGHVAKALDWIIEAKATRAITDEPAVDLLLATIDTELARREGNLAQLRTAVSALAEASKSRIDQLDADHPHALTAVANLAAAEFQLASEEDSSSRRERSVEVLEVIASRLAVELGADHPQSLIALANFIIAEIETIMADGATQGLTIAIASLGFGFPPH